MKFQKFDTSGEPYSVEYETMVKALEAFNVMSISAKDGGFQITEECDYYFSLHVTPEQLKALGEELILMSQTACEAK